MSVHGAPAPAGLISQILVYILGVKGFSGTKAHDPAAALVRDGIVLAAAEEERFNRRKHAPGCAPVEATKFCLNYAGISLEKVDAIAYGWNSQGKAVTLLPEQGREDWIDRVFPAAHFKQSTLPPIYLVPHHISHIAAAYYLSGFDDAACICADGQGESEAITLAYANRGDLKIVRTYDKIYSLGALYEAASAYCGLGWGVPGKLMGLASYGTPRHPMPIHFDARSGEFRQEIPGLVVGQSDLDAVCQGYIRYFEKNIYPFRQGSPDECLSYIHVASSVQHSIERVILGLATYLRSCLPTQNLVLCGGVALNCTCNGAVERSCTFEQVFVPPGANDASCSIGAAMEVARINGAFDASMPPQLLDAGLGPSFSDEEIASALRTAGLDFVYYDEETLTARVARELHHGSVALWFQGRAEFGPRALGGRSILASPCTRSNHYRVNLLKQRELWRPLSPSILEEYYHLYYASAPTPSTNFMLKAEASSPRLAPRVSAVVHIDGSARPQVVRKSLNPRYHRLITKFEKLSGVPILLNTSMNRRGEPIVNTPTDALEMFRVTVDADLIVLGNFVVKRR